MLSNHLILCRPLLLLPLIFPSIRVFSNELALCIRWPKFWASASATVLPTNLQGLFPLGLTGVISLQFKGLSRVFSRTKIQKHKFFGVQLSLWFMVQLSHLYMTPGKNIVLTIWTFVSKVVSLLSKVCHSFPSKDQVFQFHGCSHHLLWLWSTRK